VRVGATVAAGGRMATPPLWPPLLATRGPGAKSDGHAHHAMHIVLAVDGELAYRTTARGAWQRAAGVVTAPDVAHALDGSGVEIFLVFIDPESDVGASLRAAIGECPLRALDAAERDAIMRAGADPRAIMRADGSAWTAHVAAVLGGAREAPATARPVHPRVRRLVRLLRELPPEADMSLPALAAEVGLSPGRLMHAFTESIGIPLRPYLVWLRLQRAAAAIVGGLPLSEAAVAAGFTDAAHMSRTFRRMFGMVASSFKPASPRITRVET
jgi:AraC-like DNA-binding protein